MFEETCDSVQDGGLAATGWAHDRNELASRTWKFMLLAAMNAPKRIITSRKSAASVGGLPLSRISELVLLCAPIVLRVKKVNLFWRTEPTSSLPDGL
ncbi:hypothetical protein [Bradyrhizobium hereditatis]|uniref:hypothetical protein n=1 Tax=Bradyrhizobium hereditatis TaxID=2821405 RepID=UPI001CE338B6|nr:hypothetical protein [Bradyrhizobium hereditatis]